MLRVPSPRQTATLSSLSINLTSPPRSLPLLIVSVHRRRSALSFLPLRPRTLLLRTPHLCNHPPTSRQSSFFCAHPTRCVLQPRLAPTSSVLRVPRISFAFPCFFSLSFPNRSLLAPPTSSNRPHVASPRRCALSFLPLCGTPSAAPPHLDLDLDHAPSRCLDLDLDHAPSRCLAHPAPSFSLPCAFDPHIYMFESDSSPTRRDFYQFNGDNYHLQLPYFQTLYDLPPAGPSANYDLDILFQFRQTRFQQSVAQNPYFFYGQVEMANCIRRLSRRFSQRRNLEIPVRHHDWLERDTVVHARARADPRRSLLDQYTFAPVFADLAVMWARYPQLLAIGGNVNGVNTHAPIDIENLTGSVYCAEALLQGDNAACFAHQALQLLVPDALNGLASFVDIIETDRRDPFYSN
ncbi:hypothetical protein C8R45DRAFT_1147804 [Mycena sanguinolenta]|nr:hypothetical protein C8R45DRAFT_1147804 [Mycena sanguinolenta]